MTGKAALRHNHFTYFAMKGRTTAASSEHLQYQKNTAIYTLVLQIYFIEMRK
jgi:hypothetical protein